MARQKSTQAHPRLAKLTPPRLPVVLNRARLFCELDRAAHAPLTWLAAPPGAGKTTLLASYLRQRPRPVLWYRLDAGDADPSTLFHYLGLAVQTAAPRFRTRLPHLAPEYMAGLPTFTQRFFEQLGRRFPRPTTIVFDNYHEVPLDSLIHQLLPVGIQQLLHHIRVVVLSRERSPASYARLQAEQHLETIQAAALELTREEAHQLSRLRRTAMRKEDTRSSVDQVWEQTKGWVAGCILLWQHNEREKTLVSLAPHQSSQAIFDYLAGEVMERFTQDIQTLLLAVSFLSDFTAQMAQELSSVPQAADILEQLHQARYFVERREDRIGWYRFHPLFQEFLLRRAEQVWTPAVLRERQRQAAALLVEAQQAEPRSRCFSRPTRGTIIERWFRYRPRC
jgi:ATP/maltotriose-dependent transcriptional regulator MalT